MLAPYLQEQAAEFLRSLRLHRENSAPTDAGSHTAEEAAGALRRSSRRIGGTLHTFRAALDTAWAEQLRTELAWLSGTLAREHAYATRLNRLLEALHHLSGTSLPTARTASGSGTGSAGDKERAVLGVGAARAGALLERQLTLARTRAHSAALQALGSSRFHAVADAVALLASEVPLAAAATAPAEEMLHGPADRAEQQLLGAVAALPSDHAAEPYNEAQDAPWHRTRLLLRLHRYAHEVVRGAPIRSWPRRGTPSICTGTRRRRPRRRHRRPARPGSRPRPRTPWGCSTPISGTRWRRRATGSGRAGRTRTRR